MFAFINWNFSQENSQQTNKPRYESRNKVDKRIRKCVVCEPFFASILSAVKSDSSYSKSLSLKFLKTVAVQNRAGFILTIQKSFVSCFFRYFKVSTRYETVLLVFILKLEHLDDNQESNKKDQTRCYIDSKSSEASLNFANPKIFPLDKCWVRRIKYLRPFTHTTIASSVRFTKIFVL